MSWAETPASFMAFTAAMALTFSFLAAGCSVTFLLGPWLCNAHAGSGRYFRVHSV